MKKNFLFVAIIALFIGLAFHSCKKDDKNTPDDGKIDPSTIANANLIAYWGFENSPKDEIGQRGVASASVSYPTGRRGMAFQGGTGSYISFDLPASDKLATMKAFTIAMWIKAPTLADANGIPCFFQLSGKNWNGAFSIYQDNLGDNTADSLRLRSYFGKQGANWAGQWVDQTNPIMTADKWFHFVLNYDNTTSISTMYINGDAYKVQTLSAYDTPVRYQDDPGGADNPNGAAKLGDLNLELRSKAPTDASNDDKGIIGYWAIKAFYGGTDDWQGFFSGMIDELRVYDKALSDQEVKDLYDAEVTQVN